MDETEKSQVQLGRVLSWIILGVMNMFSVIPAWICLIPIRTYEFECPTS